MKNKLLIVDDEPEILDLFSAIFREDYTVATAASGEEGLQLLEKETFHVILLDLNLPGIDGIETCRTIKKNYPMSIVFAITGYVSLFHLSDCREAGFDNYFAKPVPIDLIKEEVKHAFRQIERWTKR